VICANCGAENELGRKFCLNCGQRLAVICSNCGTPNTPGARFCGECGHALPADEAGAGAATGAARPATIASTGAAASPATAPLAGTALTAATERRLVSILFADLVGFTTISEARDAEDVRELLSRYFEICREVVERYGGTVEKFIGDAVMAVWGTPVAREDDAERAVRAGLDLVDAIGHLGAKAGVPDLALRAAVHTGEAVVTIGATGMGMVAGDLVNTASRLQSVAPPGSVLVGEGTRRAASESIAFEEAGEQTLKGKASPVPAFRALRVVARRGGAGRSEQLEPPFVGRDSELQLIKDFYHATTRDRGPRLVSAIGQAGIGKSRLAWEFLKYVDGVAETVYWHQGRSPSYGEGITFWALGEMVRMRVGITEDADEALTRERISAALDAFVPDPEERRSVEAAILQLLGVSDAQGGDRGELFVAWRTFFERIAEIGPVVMVFEDLQWADEGLLDFIEELVTWSRGRPIYVITLARAELLDRRPTWGAGQRSFTSLSLAALNDEDIGELLTGLVPGLPEGTMRAIVERAEGIPLYAVETVRMLINDGRLEPDGDVYRPVGDLDRLAIPESLHALIASRIDGLVAGERMLVQDASVLGLSFTLAALTAVRAAIDQLEPMLRHLVQRELLTFDDDPRSPERGQYRFVQGLMREVAYGTLARDDRRARHLAAARYYEALGEDELSGVLAQHYVDAYQAHPDGPEGAAVAAQARVALRGAAQRAIELGSPRHAHGYLMSALLVVTDPREELDLRMTAGTTAADAGLLDVSSRHFERAIALATELGDDAARRIGVARLGRVLLEGHHERARKVVTEVFEEPGLSPQDPGYVELAETLARLEMRAMNHERAVEIADRVLPVAAATHDDGLVVDLVVTRAVALANLDRMAEAVVALSGAAEFAERRGAFEVAIRATINLGYSLAVDDPARAFEVSSAGLELGRKTGKTWAISYLLGNAADPALELGEWDWAMDALRANQEILVEPETRLMLGVFTILIRALRGEDVTVDADRLMQESQAFDDPHFMVTGPTALLVASLLRGDFAEAIRLGDRMFALGGIAAEAAPMVAHAAIWGGDLDAARRARGAFDLARTGRRNQALLEEMDAGIAMLEGRRSDARAAFAGAQRAFRELGVPFLLALCNLDIVITGAMEPDERRRAADEAREILTRLRAQPLLDRLNASVASEPVAPAAVTMVERAAEELRQEA
jgi:class 3 adenylate cyclase